MYLRIGCRHEAVACEIEFEYEARQDPREGDERLSGRQARRVGRRRDRSRRSNKPTASDKKRASSGRADLGRALRSVYDDTLRESVPDDFLDLLGKLS